MAETRHTAADVIAAIEGSSGIKIIIARKLKVHRNTVDNYLNRYPTARLAYEHEIAAIGDIAESVVIKAIRNEDVDTAKWYLRMKAKDRGYTERTEVTGPNGKEFVFRVVYDDDNGDR